MSEMQEGIQMAMMTGQAMAFVVDKGVTLTRQILEALAKLIKMSALYTAPKIKNAWKRQPGAVLGLVLFPVAFYATSGCTFCNMLPLHAGQ